ncbi:hypothetical protein BDV37DRAFT_236725 [Aspergillus pseudonomiae]|uniref:Uncharacterized protein n=1 Tax=Aspergillus pseudonomiae TaxID=1506151 RepID=A0A5N7DW29_9EURO|nr:uncharacterized protein BDV37DRAFT_236725 [Aspergillus pseudonomiae]KAE8409718.1 hypothetical protein BDV37DRAFT_236725 [Aspergillus pseudonomiae]
MVVNAVNRFELNFASVPGALSRQGCPVSPWHEWAKIKIDWHERHRSPSASRVND